MSKPSKNAQKEAEYLKSDEVGLVIAKAMAVTYKAQPANPIDFFAKWLLQQSKVAKTQQQLEDKAVKTKESLEKYQENKKLEAKMVEANQLVQKSHDQEIDKFNQRVNNSRDLSDELQNLVDHLQANCGSTASYIGKVVKPLKAIKEDDDDAAHIDPNAQEQIQFLFSSKDHSFMVDKILLQEQGITYSEVFGSPDEAPEEEPEAADEEGVEGEEKPKKPAKEKLPKFKLVEEIVREPKMHYYKVPRLGSYIAIKLEYNSCLFEEAFDAAVLDFIDVQAKTAEQEQKKREFEEEQAEKKQEKEDNGEEFVPEVKEWEAIEHKPFLTKKVQYVVCLNTMGQDRQFTEEQKLFALRTVQRFRDRWEALEAENLESDVNKKLERADYDKLYKENYEAIDQADLDRIVEDAIVNAQPGEGEEAISDGEKAMIGHKSRFLRIITTFYSPNQAARHKDKMDKLEKDKLKSAGGDRAASAMGSAKDGSIHDDKSVAGVKGEYFALVPEQWKEKIRDFRNLYVIKYPRIFQSLFYILKFQPREFMCERNTNCLSWKKAKVFLNNDDLFLKMSEYWPFGAKEENYKEYQKMKFIQGNLEGISEDAVDEYSVALGKVLRWVKLAISFRIEDMKVRREQKKKLRAERQEAVDKENERIEKRNAEFEAAKTAWDEKENENSAKKKEEDADASAYERLDFDAEEFYAKFDEDNLPIEIPEEVEDDVDNDFNIPIPETPAEE